MVKALPWPPNGELFTGKAGKQVLKKAFLYVSFVMISINELHGFILTQTIW